MMKIECPECKKSFIWTDDMPMTGTCPSPDCNWKYRVREQFKSNVEKKILAAQKAVLCPRCGRPVASRWTFCKNCRSVVMGSRAFDKKRIFIAGVVALLVVSLIIRLFRFI